MKTSCPSPTVALITVVGEIDLATVSLFRDRLISVLHDKTHAVIDVDLAGVSFLDCAGIGALVGVRNIAVHAGRQVAHLQPAPRRVLELTELLNALTAPIDHSEQRPRIRSSSQCSTRCRPVRQPYQRSSNSKPVGDGTST